MGFVMDSVVHNLFVLVSTYCLSVATSIALLVVQFHFGNVWLPFSPAVLGAFMTV